MHPDRQTSTGRNRREVGVHKAIASRVVGERIGWITCARARGSDSDEVLALPALARAGATVEVVDWHDPSVDWARYDRAVLRSPWDYPDRYGEFVEWLGRVAALTDLRNPLATVRWSLDKHYLAELADAGIPTVPTTFLEPEGPAAEPERPAAGTAVHAPVPPTRPREAFVVKPAVGAGSRDAAAYEPGAAAAASAHIARLHARGATVLVQPRLRSVAADGESALVYFDGRYSHAVNKHVGLSESGVVDGLSVGQEARRCEPGADEREVGAQVLDLVTLRFGTPTYARIDIVRDDAGAPRVLEVELAEPSLFLHEGGAAAVARFVDAVLRSR
jgi:hypothetical protein